MWLFAPNSKGMLKDYSIEMNFETKQSSNVADIWFTFKFDEIYGKIPSKDIFQAIARPNNHIVISNCLPDGFAFKVINKVFGVLSKDGLWEMYIKRTSATDISEKIIENLGDTMFYVICSNNAFEGTDKVSCALIALLWKGL